MTMQDLLLELRRRGVRLRLTDGQLDVLAPAGALTPPLRRALTAQRDELVALLGEAASRDDAEPVLRVPVSGPPDEPFPLTDIQHAYWVGRNPSVELGGVATHYYFELERDGLDLVRLNQSLRQVIDRHDMLRAVIGPDGLQRVLPQVPPYEIAVADLRGLPQDAQAAELARTGETLGQQVLPADRWPLFEIRASRLSDQRLVLHVSVDLLIADGFSLRLLFQDWRRFYEDPAWTPGRLPFTFRDYVLASVARRAGGEYARAEKYWRDRLGTLPPAPGLPLALPPAQVSRPRFSRRRGHLPRDQWDVIKQRGRQRGLTPSAVLMTAFADVLRLWSDQPEFTLNLSLFNRSPLHPRIGEIVGDFTSVTLLAVTTPPGEPFAVRARLLHQQLMRDLEHLSFSGVQVMRERARHQGGGQRPGALMPVVFTSMLALGPDDGPAAQTGFFGGTGFFGRFRSGISQTPQVALDHQVGQEQGDLYFNWDAVDALFCPGVLDDMFAVYLQILSRLAAGEESWDGPGPLAVLPGWQAAERRGANATAVPIAERTLCDLVFEQAERHPGATAVVAHDGKLCYRQLTEQAHRLARDLTARGAARDALVAIVLDKGQEQVAAALGVTASGAAYLPIDPDWPEARRWQLLEHGRVRLVVTTAELREELSWPPDVTPVTFADAGLANAGLASIAPGPPPVPPAPGDLAYVIFTSGSTGQPKGVMIDHRSAVNTILDINARFGVGPGDRVLALSSLSFDLSVYDIFGTLAAGGTIVMPSPAGTHDPAHWAALMDQHGVTVWNSVPALMQAWLETGAGRPGARRDALRLVLLSGDWIPVAQPDAIRAAHPQARVISLGGATEASIWSVCYPIGTVPPQWSRIPYGKPLANQTLHVYSPRLEPCPVWTVGEIYIGGIGVARGYWADPDRTAERFGTHPETGEPLYRTGDLGRYLPGGDIEFLGRADSQVKLNGHRIEPGEIAAILRRQPGVRDALVSVAASPETGRRQLVAYVIPEEPGAPGAPGDRTAADGAAEEEPAWQAVVQAGDAERRAGHSALAGELADYGSLLGAFNATSLPLIARTLARLGFFTSAGVSATATDIAAAPGIKSRYRWLIDQWLARLARDGRLSPAGPDGRYRCDRAFDEAALDAQVELSLATLTAGDPRRVLADYFANCAGHQLELLRGEVNLREFLLPDGGWEVTEAMYASNPLARLQNQVVARIVRTRTDTCAAGLVRILEVGAGTGATTVPVLAELPPERWRYCFTDVSLFFTERARSAFSAYPSVEYQAFDIDREPGPQGFPPGSADIIIAANVLHNAKNLDRSLRDLRGILGPSGLLVLVENTLNEPFHLVTVGFYQDLRTYEDGRVLPLLTPPQWDERLRAAGFVRSRAIPGDGIDPIGQHILLAHSPAGRPQPEAAALRGSLEGLLPGYMVPQHYLFIDHVPLGANGKVDLSALPAPWPTAVPGTPVAPRSQAEQQLLAIWQDVLMHGDFGVDDNFFELGGDSLHALRIIGRLREELGIQTSAEEGLQMLFDSPTIAALARALTAWPGRLR